MSEDRRRRVIIMPLCSEKRALRSATRADPSRRLTRSLSRPPPTVDDSVACSISRETGQFTSPDTVTSHYPVQGRSQEFDLGVYVL